MQKKTSSPDFTICRFFTQFFFLWLQAGWVQPSSSQGIFTRWIYCSILNQGPSGGGELTGPVASAPHLDQRTKDTLEKRERTNAGEIWAVCFRPSPIGLSGASGWRSVGLVLFTASTGKLELVPCGQRRAVAVRPLGPGGLSVRQQNAEFAGFRPHSRGGKCVGLRLRPAR